MTFDRETARQSLHQKIQSLADSEFDWTDIQDKHLTQEGILDSSAIVEFIVWCQKEFGTPLKIQHLTADNFGTLNKVLDYLAAAR